MAATKTRQAAPEPAPTAGDELGQLTQTTHPAGALPGPTNEYLSARRELRRLQADEPVAEQAAREANLRAADAEQAALRRAEIQNPNNVVARDAAVGQAGKEREAQSVSFHGERRRLWLLKIVALCAPLETRLAALIRYREPAQVYVRRFMRPERMPTWARTTLSDTTDEFRDVRAAVGVVALAASELPAVVPTLLAGRAKALSKAVRELANPPLVQAVAAVGAEGGLTALRDGLQAQAAALDRLTATASWAELEQFAARGDRT